MNLSLSRIVVALLVATPVALAQKPAKEDIKLMEGTWIPVSAELNGMTLPEEGLKSMKLVIQKDEYTVHVGNQLDHGTLNVDSSKTPRRMDIKGVTGPNKDKLIPAIYELKDDTLKICYNLQDMAPPKEFKTKDKPGLFLVLYRRDKK